MSNPIISIEGVGKQYTLGATQSYLSLRDAIAGIFGKRPSQKNKFWALKDLTLDIGPGEAIGVIGRNGAGKSTLLKILSQITPPSRGRITLRGRVASLLEVGTGFHPELTGRENIYLNGAVLGMSRAEVKRKFDQIVDFAEIGQFLDTPVKRYSSGMYVRLAFAVAAHLEPEILIVDEVLAVGDARFQKKCLNKMGEVGQEGRTIIFVSHNMAVINELCQRTLWLDKGTMVDIGPTATIVGKYLSEAHSGDTADVDLSGSDARKNSLESSAFQFQRLRIINAKGRASSTITLGETFSIEIHGLLHRQTNDWNLGFNVNSSLGYPLFNSFATSQDLLQNLSPGPVVFRVNFDPNIFGPGMYAIGLGANGTEVTDWIPEATTFTVERLSTDPDQVIGQHYDGVVLYPCHWNNVSANKQARST